MIWLSAMAAAGCVWWLFAPSASERLRGPRAAADLAKLRARLRPAGAAARVRARAIAALAALASELRAGQPPTSALSVAGGDPPVWPAAVRAASLGGDIAEGLGKDAEAVPLLRPLAACWAACSASGSGLASAVDRLATGARAAEELRLQLAGQLAAPRATARMLSLLPLIGILLGVLMGADPLGWLTGTAPGFACLMAGVLLAVLGALWTAAIARSVERRL